MICSVEVKLIKFEEVESKVLKLNLNLDDMSKRALIKFLKSNLYVFSWKLKDMLGIDPKLISHILKDNSTKKPMQQRKRKFPKEKN